MGIEHVYEVRPCKDKRGVDLISDALRSLGCGMVGPETGASRFISRAS